MSQIMSEMETAIGVRTEKYAERGIFLLKMLKKDDNLSIFLSNWK
jgi:hypothetical protein